MGGRARRFDGRDKSAIVVGRRSILDRQVAALAEITDDILLVGARDYAPSGTTVVADRVPDSGPLGGLDAALAAARDNAVVIVACDMPFVTAPLLAYLLQWTSRADAVVPRTERGYHPLCAAYTRACHEPVMRRLRDGRLKMLDLLEDVQVHAVDRDELDRFGDPDVLLANVNTPGELRDLEALLGHEQ